MKTNKHGLIFPDFVKHNINIKVFLKMAACCKTPNVQIEVS